jgi:branched-chain amino acid transport system substrate-binding protein
MDLSRTGGVRAVCAVMVLAAVATIALAGCQRTPDTLKVGVGQPLSGNLKALGQDMLNGAQMAADEINAAGGVRLGSQRVRVEIVAQDDKADAKAGEAAATALVDAGVLVALAHLNSGVSIAAAPIYAKAGVPQFAISTKPAYTQLNLPTTLRLVANDKLQSRAMGEYAAQLTGAERFAVIDDNTPYGKGLADDAAASITARGKKVASRHSLDDKTVEFTALVAEMAGAKVDVIVTTLSDFQVEALIKQLVKAGLTQMRILGGDTIKTDRLLKAGGQVGAIYATSPIIEAREFSNGAKFLADFRERFKGEPVYGAHYAYDTVHLVADALMRNGSLDKAQLLQRLKTFDGSAPVTGSLRFRPDGEQVYGAIAVYELRGGQWTPLMRSDRW